MRLTTSHCKKKLVENLLRKKRRGQGPFLCCGATDDDGDMSYHQMWTKSLLVLWNW
jgi:hypothetical protein